MQQHGIEDFYRYRSLLVKMKWKIIRQFITVLRMRHLYTAYNELFFLYNLVHNNVRLYTAYNELFCLQNNVRVNTAYNVLYCMHNNVRVIRSIQCTVYTIT